ncbi:hypothetical protein Tco_1210300 [Tanacetum coccineum]
MDNSRKKTRRDPKGNIMILPPVSGEEHIAVQRETKARTILLQSLPEDHIADFHHLDDARDIWFACQSQVLGGFQKKRVKLIRCKLSKKMKECNMRFVSSEHIHFLVTKLLSLLKTKRVGLDYLSFDDLYNKLRTLEIDVKGGSSYDSRGTSAPTHSAFINAANTNSKMSYADSQNQLPSITFTTASSSADTSSNVIESVLHSSLLQKVDKKRSNAISFSEELGTLLGNVQGNSCDSKCKVLLQSNLKSLISPKEPKALFVFDSMLNWSDQEGEDEEERCSPVIPCPFGCEHKYAELKKDFDNLEVQYKDCYIQVQAYKNTLQTLEQQKAWYQNNQLALEERIRILTADLENTTNMLKYTNDQVKLEKLNDQVKLEESKARFDKWKESSKNLDKLINSSMSSRSKFGLGFGETFGSDEVFDPSAPSIFDTTPEDVEGKPLYDRFVKAVGMHAVPSPITGTFMPPSNKPDLDDTQVTYGSKSNSYFETNSISNDFVSYDNSDKSSDSETTGFASCVSSVKSSSSKTNEHLASASSSVDFKTVSKTADQKPSSTIDDPSFSFKENVKTPRNICNKSGINNRSHCKINSFGFKTCFVFGSKFHLIKDCDFYEKQLGLYNKPMWNNVANIPLFVPRAASVPAGSRNPPASVFAGSAFPAGSRNRPASVSDGLAVITNCTWMREDGELLLRPQQVVLRKLKGHVCSRDPRTMVDLINLHGLTLK